MSNVLLEMRGIRKSFGMTHVLHGIDLIIEEGKVYALAGENGAGKSTLCNILSGAYSPSEGVIIYKGREFKSLSIEMAKKELGIRMVHQELQILPMMTIAENVFIGDEISNKGFVNKKEMNNRTKHLLEEIGLNIEPTVLMQDIDIAGRQLVEILRAINGNAKLILLDEPTSSLSQSETSLLFDIIKKLKGQGISFVFVSHRLEELLEIGDTIMVMKDGNKVIELNAKETDEDEIVKNMVGRSFSDYYNREQKYKGKEILRLEHVTSLKNEKRNNAYNPTDISFSLKEGEVLGIAGLVGAGRTELIRTLFGDLKMASGKIFVNGQEVKINNSSDALQYGMAWITEDRKQGGLILEDTVEANTSLVVLKKLVNKLLINDKKVREIANEYIQVLRIKTEGPEQIVSNLSGGNQQKVVLAKWLVANPQILVMDEPTRGVDVGAKTEIYKLINQLTESGMAVILISSELHEVMGMADRMIVMYEGKITGELSREEYTEETIMQYATGRTKSE